MKIEVKIFSLWKYKIKLEKGRTIQHKMNKTIYIWNNKINKKEGNF